MPKKQKSKTPTKKKVLTPRTVKKIKPKLCIYYCANNMSKGSVGANKLVKWENDFIFELFCILWWIL